MSTLTRLRSMPAREIGYRLRERLQIEAERIRLHLAPGHTLDTGSHPEAYCRGSLALAFDARFYISPSDRVTIRRFVEDHFPEWLEKATTEAEDLCRHRMELLGYEPVELGPKIQWHRDPITGTEWPRRFWADYDPVHDTSCGDPKLVHELNRHQHLPRLGKAFFLTGDERFAGEAIAQMLDWIEQNPVGTGINWQSSLEISIRALSWLWTICFVVDADSLTEKAAKCICSSLVEQMRHVYHYPSIYSSPNTHLIGEAAVLFITGHLLSGTTLAEDGEAARWRDFGFETLTREIEHQVLEDGTHCELSAYYHCYAADFFLQAMLLVRGSRFDFPKESWSAIEKMLEFVMSISSPDGTIPQLGDDDGGRTLALDQRNYRSYLDGLSIGSVVFGRADFKRQARRFHEEAYWLLGRGEWLAWLKVPSTAPSERGRTFSDAGYIVQRSGWESTDSHLVFDCGGLGLPTGGHGHADALSVVMSANGRPTLVDPGTLLYNGAPEWRNFFRSTRAHNTVVVDGQDQSQTGGTFQWQSRATTRQCRQFASGNLEYVEAEHYGYERLTQPVTHKRRVLYSHPGYWVIVDELTGQGTHNFDFLYHFSPYVGLAVSAPSGAPVQVYGDDVQLFLDARTALNARFVVGEEAPIQGWMSPQYGAIRPAQALCASVECGVPLQAATVIATSANTIIRREEIPGCALSYSITTGSDKDLIIVPDGQSVQTSGLQLRGELFWLRTRRGLPKQLLGIGVEQIIHNAVNEKVLFDAPFVADHFLVSFSEGSALCVESAGF